jgi:hypothetical protein
MNAARYHTHRAGPHRSAVRSPELAKAMIRFTCADSHRVELDASASGLRVYLDHWAIIELARHNSSRRRRFVEAICAKGDLLFSFANIAESVGLKGKSAEVVKDFLNSLGANWVPVELSEEVIRLEMTGADSTRNFLSKELLEAYVPNRMATHPRSEIVDLSENFFRLGPILDWVAGAGQFREQSKKFDELMAKVREYYDRYIQNGGRDLRLRVFNPSQRCAFAFINLMRLLIEESKAHQAKKNDGMDFCHSIIGSAFAHFAALDGPWKRRVESLPKPNDLARIYSAGELDQMVADIESWSADPYSAKFSHSTGH